MTVGYVFAKRTYANNTQDGSMKIKIKDVSKDKKGWSLYRLAKELSLPQQTVYSWASGRTQPSYENMDRLCDVLDCGVGELFETEPVQRRLF
jgi:DNA-binding Xre family transcriptional regulator